jgi:hypothetical protein
MDLEIRFKNQLKRKEKDIYLVNLGHLEVLGDQHHLSKKCEDMSILIQFIC